MADLRNLLKEAGFDDVTTYLQSGNAVFDVGDDTDLRSRLETLISERFGMKVGVVVVTPADMQLVIESCPYRAEADADPTKVHVTFLDPPLGAGLEVGEFSPDEFQLGPGVIYMHLPDGMGRSKLPGALDKATRNVLATTRNWRTVLAVNDLLT